MAKQADTGTIGRIVVAATTPALFIVLPEIVSAFTELMPNVDVAVRTMSTSEQEEALRRGDIDVGIVHPPLDDKDLACHDLATLPFDVVLSVKNPLNELPTLRMSDLARQTFILFPRQIGPQLYDHIIGLCRDEG
ncbi:LysR family substrate-binding domain-containing protein, partial [Pseudomonas sp. SB113]|uniref:LysR family substrate-binding domain-containing protein n=1 Tax=Pseudomonas sp. SB113 TaxID=3154123 RepID=UPI00345D2438